MSSGRRHRTRPLHVAEDAVERTIDGLAWWEPATPLAPGVQVAVTTRIGGISSGNRAALNLATHVGDDAACVAENRRRLQTRLMLPAAPLWLQQVHGIAVVDAAGQAGGGSAPPVADAAVAREAGQVLAVLTADCLPVVLAARDGGSVGVAHAGWRGLAHGVLEATLSALPCRPADVVAWLGPAIGPAAFEVGDEVQAAFTRADAAAAAAFTRNARGRWQADLFLLARQRLARAGVGQVRGGGACTVSDPARWFSYRRDHSPAGDTGRFATLAWIEAG